MKTTPGHLGGEELRIDVEDVKIGVALDPADPKNAYHR
jgi:hypothetical protein